MLGNGNPWGHSLLAGAPTTRRQLVKISAAAAALTAATSGPARLVARAAAAAADPAYLRRKSYMPLVGGSFRASGLDLRLAAVSDLARAKTEPAFRGRDDAFALTFLGPASPVLKQGVHEFRSSALGTFMLFAVPTGRPTGGQRYEVVIDRSARV